MFTIPSAKNISVVVQGVMCSYTASVLQSIRRHLPQAEIVLSTWKGQSLDGLEADFILQNEDPGGCVCSESGMLQNLNRQLVSTRNGVKTATREYILKLRTDTLLTGNRFLSYWDQFPKREEDFSVFSHRILICSFYTRPARWKKQAYLFHPSDWVSFGTKEDMLLLWDIPEVQEPDFSQFFMKDCQVKKSLNQNWQRLFPEQYFWLACLKKQGINTGVETQHDYSEDLAILSNHYLHNNFLTLEYQDQFDIYNMKYKCKFCDSKIQHFRQFLLFYKQNCDYNYKISVWSVYRELLEIEDDMDKIKFHIFRILRHRRRPLEVLGQTFGIFYYMIMIVVKSLRNSYKLITFR